MIEDVFVEGLSASAIECRALAWRDAFGVGDRWVPDIAAILEFDLPQIFPDFALVVRDDLAMEDAEAYTQADPPMIVLRQSVYRDSVAGVPRSRMTLAHELGHLVLHKSVL